MPASRAAPGQIQQDRARACRGAGGTSSAGGARDEQQTSMHHMNMHRASHVLWIAPFAIAVACGGPSRSRDAAQPKGPRVSPQLAQLEPVRTVRAGALDVAYYEAGPKDGNAVLLLHGFPYDIHSFVDVVPRLADAGLRVIVPYLRGFGPTRFVDRSTPRSGQQAALGADVIALMDALEIPRAILGGYDWGARAANVVAALWPERCAGLVSVNSYLIQDISAATNPIRPSSKPASGTSSTSRPNVAVAGSPRTGAASRR